MNTAEIASKRNARRQQFWWLHRVQVVGVSPLAFCAETSQNTVSGPEAWVTPRFGLAPTPAETEAGAPRQGLRVRVDKR
jgi:hypothetical protein